jgi:undecaprenyl-diphosphatase
MPIYQIVVLAIVQGLTEFLPISSTAHLALAPWLFGWRDPGLAFDIALHIGTLAAVLGFFFRDWLQIAAQGFGIRYSPDPELKEQPRLLWVLAVATLPVAILGLIFHDQAESSWRSPFVMGGMLIGVGVLMALADRKANLSKDIAHISFLDAMVVGLAQAISIIPGTSRSGITITGALACGVNRPAAARFSFLLSTPAIAGAAAKALWDLHKAGGVPPDMRLGFVLGIALSAVTGWLVIKFLLEYLRRNTLTFFVWYRLIFGIIVIALAFFRV